MIAGGDYETSVRAQAEAFVETAAAIATRPRDEWVRLGAEARIGLQPILSPEAALLDEPLTREGVIVELDDPELGPIRQVGHVYAFDGVESAPDPAPRRRWLPMSPRWPPSGHHNPRRRRRVRRRRRRWPVSSCSTSASPSPGRSDPRSSPTSGRRS